MPAKPTTDAQKIIDLKRKITDLESEKVVDMARMKGSLDMALESLARETKRADENYDAARGWKQKAEGYEKERDVALEKAAEQRTEATRLSGYRERVETEDRNAMQPPPTLEEALAAWHLHRGTGLDMADQYHRNRYGRR